MRSLFLSALALNFFVHPNVYGQVEVGGSSIIPQAADALVATIVSEYVDDIQKRFGLTLTAKIRWDENLAPYLASGNPEIINGSALALNEQGFSVGLASSEARSLHIDIRMSSKFSPWLGKDALAAVVCHEIGHFLGGGPRIGPWMRHVNSDLVGMAVEGEADYFTATQCLPRIFRRDLKPKCDSVPQKVRVECGKKFSVALHSALCERVQMAGYSMLQALTNLEQPLNFGYAGENTPTTEVNFDRRDRRQVFWTDWQHPSNQCRLDTFINGALKKKRPRCWKGFTLFDNV